MLSNTSVVVGLYPPTIPHKRCNLLSAWFVKGRLTAEKVQKFFTESQIPKDNAFLNLRRVWTTFLGYAFWKTDINFNISNHIRQYDYGGGLNLPVPSSADDIKEILSKLETVGWREHQSPWELLFVNSVLDSTDGSTQTCIIIRSDHVLGDGFSIYNFLDALFNKETIFPGKNSGQVKISTATKLRTFFTLPYYTVLSFVPLLFGSKIYVGKLSNDVRCSFSPGIPVKNCKDIAKFHKVSFQAVVQCVVQRAIMKALLETTISIPKNVCIRSPIPVYSSPNHPTGFVNYFTLATAELPTLFDPVSTHLIQIERNLTGMKSFSTELLYQNVTGIISAFPIAIRRVMCKFLSDFGLSYAISTFPCPIHPEYIDGLEITQMIAITGIHGSPGMTVLTAGTNQELVFGFCVDRVIFQPEETIRKLGIFVEDEINDLLKIVQENPPFENNLNDNFKDGAKDRTRQMIAELLALADQVFQKDLKY
ncbi:unnamed protein product [Allacma fusca]|uniref:O-acyltransferase WSD1 C-terminal domain-containing protein n=1 Tax=Allacma fusca TaxID=39272 RepID=A0A8J2JI72_9HEXA|nr:unnamed protein product [Allacma fusca]